MIKINGACPMPPIDVISKQCSDYGIEAKSMRYIGKRDKEWIDNKVDASYGETYLVTDKELYYMSIGANEWITWPAANHDPKSHAEKKKVYVGALATAPTAEAALSQLTLKEFELDELTAGIELNIAADEQYVTIAFPTAVGTIEIIKEDGHGVTTDFNNVIPSGGTYTIYYTSGQVYDPDGEINYFIKWEI